MIRTYTDNTFAMTSNKANKLEQTDMSLPEENLSHTQPWLKQSDCLQELYHLLLSQRTTILRC